MTEKKIIKSQRKSKIKIGDRFGRLTVLENMGIIKGKTWFKCVCDCGAIKLIRSNSIGNTKSCGCLQKEVLLKRITKHGMYRTATYHIWQGMIQRCTNPKAEYYKDYGGRGIKASHRWRKFENFFSDMGMKPDGLTIERINNDKGYYKENCCWASPAQQARNTRLSQANTTGVKGVAWHKTTQKYQASICVNYKRIHLGSYEILEQAAIARKNGEQKHWK